MSLLTVCIAAMGYSSSSDSPSTTPTNTNAQLNDSTSLLSQLALNDAYDPLLPQHLPPPHTAFRPSSPSLPVRPNSSASNRSSRVSGIFANYDYTNFSPSHY